MSESNFIGTDAPTGRIRVGARHKPPGSPVSTGGVSDKTATIRLNVPRGSLSWHAPEESLPSIRIAAPVDSGIPVSATEKKNDKKTLFRAPRPPSPGSSLTMEPPPDDDEIYKAQELLTPRQAPPENRFGNTAALLDVDDDFLALDEYDDKPQPITVVEKRNNWALLLCSSLFFLLAGLLAGTFIVAPRIGVPHADTPTDDDVYTQTSVDEPDKTAAMPAIPRPLTTPKTTGLRIKRLVLLDAQTGAEIQEITDGAEIDVTGHGPGFNVRAETVPERVGCVRFAWNGTTCNLDQEPPYLLFTPNAHIKHHLWNARPGLNRLVVTPHKNTGRNDITGQGMRVSFTIKGFNGLIGKYYASPDLSGEARVRVDPKIDFDWGSKAPIRGIVGSRYSVSWEGIIVAPRPVNYTFHITADGAIRLWVGRKLIIKGTGEARKREYRGVAKLKGRNSIRLDFLDVDTRGVIQLSWKDPKQAETVVPSSALLPLR